MFTPEEQKFEYTAEHLPTFTQRTYANMCLVAPQGAPPWFQRPHGPTVEEPNEDEELTRTYWAWLNNTLPAGHIIDPPYIHTQEQADPAHEVAHLPHAQLPDRHRGHQLETI